MDTILTLLAHALNLFLLFLAFAFKGAGYFIVGGAIGVCWTSWRAWQERPFSKNTEFILLADFIISALLWPILVFVLIMMSVLLLLTYTRKPDALTR